MTNYPLGNFLIQIKNSSMAKRKDVSVNYSKVIYSVAEVLKKEKYLSEIKKTDDILSVKLAYVSKLPVLIQLKLISKPGKRVYKTSDEIKLHKGPSFFIVSTPQGVMTSKQAIKNNIGGEIICEIH